MITFTRKEAIMFLVEREITDIAQMLAHDDYHYLTDIFTAGFTGYMTYTLLELKREIEESAEYCHSEDTITVIED